MKHLVKRSGNKEIITNIYNNKLNFISFIINPVNKKIVAYSFFWFIFYLFFCFRYSLYIATYWEYKLVRSIQKCIYFKTKWMNRSIKVLSIAAYCFFPSLRQFSNSISKKWLVFGGDPILEPIFDFCERNGTGDLPNRAASFGTTSN